jgi:hypothetical protein
MSIKSAVLGSAITLVVVAGGVTAIAVANAQTGTTPVPVVIAPASPVPSPSVTYTSELIPPAMPNVNG